MEGLLIILFLGVLLLFITGMRNKPVEGLLKAKQCPPHKWSHIEIKDHLGEVQGWKLVCAHCGPIGEQDKSPRRLDD